MSEPVECNACKKTVGLDGKGYLRTHRRKGAGICNGSGRHVKFNGPQRTEATK